MIPTLYFISWEDYVRLMKEGGLNDYPNNVRYVVHIEEQIRYLKEKEKRNELTEDEPLAVVLTDDKMEKWAIEEFFSLSNLNLKYLELPGMGYHQRAYRYLPKFFSDNKTLEHLVIELNVFLTTKFEVFKYLADNSNFKNLEFTKEPAVPMGQKEIKTLFESLKNVALEELTLYWVKNKGVIELVKALGEQSILSESLRTLNLDINGRVTTSVDELVRTWLFSSNLLIIETRGKYIEPVLESDDFKSLVKDFLEGKIPPEFRVPDDLTLNEKLYHIYKMYGNYSLTVPDFVQSYGYDYDSYHQINVISLVLKKNKKVHILLSENPNLQKVGIERGLMKEILEMAGIIDVKVRVQPPEDGEYKHLIGADAEFDLLTNDW